MKMLSIFKKFVLLERISVATLIMLIGCSTKSLNSLSDQELTVKLLIDSGAGTNLRSLPQSLQEGLEKQRDKFETHPELFEIMQKSFSESFAAPRLLGELEREINLKLNRKDRLAILQWYDSGLGKKVRDMEHFIETEKGQKAFQRYIKSFESEENNQVKVREVTEEERDLLEFAANLARETNALQLMVDTMSSISLGLIMGFNGLVPESKRLNIFEIDQRIFTIRQQLTDQLAPSIVMVMAYTYKDLSKSERDQFLDFFTKSVGKKYIDTITRGVSLNLEKAAMRVGDSVNRAVAQLPDERLLNFEEGKILPKNSTPKGQTRKPASLK